MARRERTSMQRGLSVLDRRGRRIGSVRRVGEKHLEVWRVLQSPLLVPLLSVQRLDAQGVHMDALASELAEGTLEAEGSTEAAPVASIEQARSRNPERWREGPSTLPQQDHPGTGD